MARYPLTEQQGRAGSGAHLLYQNAEMFQSEGMRWAGQYDDTLEAGYAKNQVVVDDGWTMISKIDGNLDRPSPQRSGDEFWVSDLPGTVPPWTNDTDLASALYLIQRYTFPQAFFHYSTRAFIPTGNIGNTMELWAVLDPLGKPDTNVIFPRDVIEAGDEGQYLEIPRGVNLIPAGTVIDVVLLLRSDAGPIQWNGPWNALRQNGNASQGEARHQSGSNGTDFHYIDNDATDQQSNMELLQAGDEYVVDGISFSINSTTPRADGIRVLHSPTTRPQAGVKNYAFTRYGQKSISYVYVPNWFSSFPEVSGALANSYDPSSLILDDHYYGVDLQLQDAVVSENWDWIP